MRVKRPRKPSLNRTEGFLYRLVMNCEKEDHGDKGTLRKRRRKD